MFILLSLGRPKKIDFEPRYLINTTLYVQGVQQALQPLHPIVSPRHAFTFVPSPFFYCKDFIWQPSRFNSCHTIPHISLYIAFGLYHYIYCNIIYCETFSVQTTVKICSIIDTIDWCSWPDYSPFWIKKRFAW